MNRGDIAISREPAPVRRKTCRCHRRGGRSCTEPKAHERVPCAAISGSAPSWSDSVSAAEPAGLTGISARTCEPSNTSTALQRRSTLIAAAFAAVVSATNRRAPVRAASSRSNRRALPPIPRPRTDRPSHIPVSKVSRPSLRAILIIPTFAVAEDPVCHGARWPVQSAVVGTVVSQKASRRGGPARRCFDRRHHFPRLGRDGHGQQRCERRSSTGVSRTTMPTAGRLESL